MPSQIWNFLRDPAEQAKMGNALTDAANRGMVAGTLGAPVDLATQATNLLIAGGGYAGHKMGLLSTPLDLIDPKTVPGSSEWMVQKMQNAGLLSPNRNALAEAGMGLLAPAAFMGANKLGGLLFNAEQGALANAAKPSAMAMRGQRGAINMGNTYAPGQNALTDVANRSIMGNTYAPGQNALTDVANRSIMGNTYAPGQSVKNGWGDVGTVVGPDPKDPTRLLVKEGSGIFGWKIDSISASPKAAQAFNPSETVRLYHGSNESAVPIVQDGGFYGGVFASPSKQSAASHIMNDRGSVNFADIPKSAIAKSSDLANISGKKLSAALSAVSKELPAGSSRQDIRRIFQSATENGSAYDEPGYFTRTLGISDVGEADLTLQRIRGRIAHSLGFKAVEMPDEHGMSYLLTPGVKLSIEN